MEKAMLSQKSTIICLPCPDSYKKSPDSIASRSTKENNSSSVNLDTNLFHLYSYINNISMDEYCFINKICNTGAR